MSREQILAELQSRGVQPQVDNKAAIRAELQRRGVQPAQAPEPQEGIPRTALEQGLQGATFGFSDEISNLIGAGIASVATDEDFSSLLAEAKKGTTARQKRQIEQNPATAIGANILGAVGTGAAAAGTKGGQLITSLITRGAIPARVATSIATGATAGAIAGAGGAEPGERLAGAEAGAKFGAVTGAALPAVTGAVSAAGRALVPKIDEATKALANRAKEFGIPLRVDQIDPTKFRKTVQKVGQEIPFSGDEAFTTLQRKAFTKAVAKTIGQETEDLSPAVIQKFRTDVGKKFDVILEGKDISIPENTVQRLTAIKEEARNSIETGLADVVDKNVDLVLEQIQAKGVATGILDVAGQPITKAAKQLTGEKLASIRSETLKRATKAQGGAREFVSDIVDAIDDVASQNISGAEAKTLEEARRQWRNFKTIQPLLEKSVDGQINPVQLLNRVASSKFISASSKVTGEDELVDLARIGKQFLPMAGGSDTFQKSALGAVATGLVGIGKAGALVGGVRGAQAINRSQRLVNKALKATTDKAPTGAPLTGLIASQAALQ